MILTGTAQRLLAFSAVCAWLCGLKKRSINPSEYKNTDRLNQTSAPGSFGIPVTILEFCTGARCVTA
jgi:hypothetical protein